MKKEKMLEEVQAEARAVTWPSQTDHDAFVTMSRRARDGIMVNLTGLAHLQLREFQESWQYRANICLCDKHRMHANEYQALAAVTEHTPDFVRLGQGPEHDRKIAQLLHAALGMMSEAGEFADALKKHIMYGKALDEVNLMEEVSDCLWYEALALRATKHTLEDCMEKNIAKLKARYGDKFTQHAAVNRDLDKERRVLEGK